MDHALRLHRRPPAAPINHGATYCHMCWTPPGDHHTGRCPETHATRRPRLAYPAEARVFRGWIQAFILLAPLYVTVLALIWSNR